MSELILWINGLMIWVNELKLWVSEHMLWVSQLTLWVPVNKSAPVNKVSPAAALCGAKSKGRPVAPVNKGISGNRHQGEGKGRLLTGGGG